MTTQHKTFLALLLTFSFSMTGYGQASSLFKVTEFTDNSLPKKTKNDFERGSQFFFEDALYSVSKTCSGEWGGTIRFKNKISGIEYSCAATCPVAVNKLNGKYYVTNTLAHIGGSSEVLEIANPDSLSVFQLPEPRVRRGDTLIYYIGDDESGSTKGTKQLVDSIGVLTLASFPYKGKLYHLVTNFEKTFVTKIENNKFRTIGLVSAQSLWTYNPEVIKSRDHHFIVFFDNDKVKGYIDVFGNKINLIRFKQQTPPTQK